ncbi:hypothetical protein Tco_0643753 [Tanacetum coccineum]
MRETCVDLQSQGNYTLFCETVSGSYYCIEIGRLSRCGVRPVNTRHRWDETCLLDIIVIKSTDVVGMVFGELKGNLFVIEHPIPLASPTDSELLTQWKALKYWFNLEWPHYSKHNMGKTIGELHAMLIEYENGLPKKADTPQVMMIKSGNIQKANKKSLNAKGKNKVKGKGKDKKVYIPQPKNPKPTTMECPAKDDVCHHYKEVGHCKRNCAPYLVELIKKKKQVGTASSSHVFIIELFSFPTNLGV